MIKHLSRRLKNWSRAVQKVGPVGSWLHVPLVGLLMAVSFNMGCTPVPLSTPSNAFQLTKAQNRGAGEGGVARAANGNPRNTKRPPETVDEEIAATDEIARFAGLHPEISYYESRRVPPKADMPWTVEIYVTVGPKADLKWSEVGYSHLLDAVVEIEKDYSAYPRGYEGHSRE